MRNKSQSTENEFAGSQARRGRAVRLSITEAQLEALRGQLAGKGLRPGHRRRVQVIMLTVEGLGGAAIVQRTGLSLSQVSRVRERFRRSGVEGLADRPRPGRGNRVPAAMVQRILAMVASPPPLGVGRWSVGRLAQPTGLSRSAVYKVLRAHGVPPYGRRASGQDGQDGPATWAWPGWRRP
jgi:transposase